MKEADDDNDTELSFHPISLAARRVMERLFAEFDDPHAQRGESERSDETGSDKAGRANLTRVIEKRFKRI